MATVPGSLVWELVKKNNCFLVKQFGNSNAKVQFTKEANNLYNVHSYKFSGLANPKTVTIQPLAGDDKAVILSTTKTKKQNAPAKLQHKNVMRKEFRKMAKAVKNQVCANNYRPDLTKPALARLSSVYRSLQVSKSGIKKKRRQKTKRLPVSSNKGLTLDHLVDDVILELLSKLEDPSHVLRAAFVCKRWLRIVSDSAFCKRYNSHRGAPPLLGFLQRTLGPQNSRQLHSMTSVISKPDFRLPYFPDARVCLDCRHGRVLIKMTTQLQPRYSQPSETPLNFLGPAYLVWDPITGEQHIIPEPEIKSFNTAAAVICTADGCEHIDCHGGPFIVVVLSNDGPKLDRISATVYSSETGAWSEAVILETNLVCPTVLPRRSTQLGDSLYFTIQGSSMVRYDLSRNSLSLVFDPMPCSDVYQMTLLQMDETTLGMAFMTGCNINIWSTSEKSGEWIFRKSIEVKEAIYVADPSCKNDFLSSDDLQPFVIGFAEGPDVIFCSSANGLLSVQLSTGKVLRIAEQPKRCISILPYMSHYAPACGRLLLRRMECPHQN